MARPLPPRPFLRGKCTHGIRETLAHVPGRTAAPYAAESSPDDCLATALDNRPAEPAGTLERPQSRRLLLLGGAQLLELIDFCMHKIMRLHYRPRDEMEKMLFVLAKELVAQLETPRGSRHPRRRRPACPPCARFAPLASERICTIYLSMRWIPGPPGAPVTAAAKRAGATAGGVGRGASVVTADGRQNAQ